jgi:hypothetical protein
MARRPVLRRAHRSGGSTRTNRPEFFIIYKIILIENTAIHTSFVTVLAWWRFRQEGRILWKIFGKITWEWELSKKDMVDGWGYVQIERPYRHNCVYWSDVNPNVILEKDVNLPGVTFWAAISVSDIIGLVVLWWYCQSDWLPTCPTNRILASSWAQSWSLLPAGRCTATLCVVWQRMAGHAFRREMDRATWATGVATSIPRPNAARFFVGCP